MVVLRGTQADYSTGVENWGDWWTGSQRDKGAGTIENRRVYHAAPGATVDENSRAGSARSGVLREDRPERLKLFSGQPPMRGAHNRG